MPGQRLFDALQMGIGQATPKDSKIAPFGHGGKLVLDWMRELVAKGASFLLCLVLKTIFGGQVGTGRKDIDALMLLKFSLPCNLNTVGPNDT